MERKSSVRLVHVAQCGDSFGRHGGLRLFLPGRQVHSFRPIGSVLALALFLGLVPINRVSRQWNCAVLNAVKTAVQTHCRKAIAQNSHDVVVAVIEENTLEDVDIDIGRHAFEIVAFDQLAAWQGPPWPLRAASIAGARSNKIPETGPGIDRSG